MEFRDFNVEILATRGDRFDVRLASQASGELQASDALARSVDELLAALSAGGASVRSAASAERVFTAVPPPDAPRVDVQGADIGQTLFDMLFSEPETSRALAECMTDAKASKAGVRLKLTLNTRDQGVADLARLPCELLHDDSKYKHFALRPDFPIVRYLEVPKPFTVERFDPPLRILAVSANPWQDLALDCERENLKTALTSVPDVELTFVERASIQTIAAAMAQASAAGRAIHVVHYMGNCDFHRGRGVLLLHKEDGGEDPVEAEAFVTATLGAYEAQWTAAPTGYVEFEPSAKVKANGAVRVKALKALPPGATLRITASLPDMRDTDAQPGRTTVRGWRGQFTARVAGPHELRATNGKGVYVWRKRIMVQ